jgi:hypothetical protein
MKRSLLPILALALTFAWSCQSDELNSVAPSAESGILLESTSAPGGNGNGNAYGLLRNCASMDVLERQLQQNPGLARKLELIEEQTRKITSTNNGNGGGKPGSGGGDGGGTTPTYSTVTIPVIVHVIWDAAKPRQKLSKAQIESQITVLNKDFRATNSEVGTEPAEFTGVLADAQLNFTLHSVTYKESTRAEWGTRDDMKYESKGGVNVVDPSTFLNIWVCNIGGGILGYAQFPGGNSATDGIVVGPNFFGSSDFSDDTFYLSAPFDKGRTTTHEIGHWLNLRHIWGDGRCNQDDYVADTPASDRSNYGCPAYPTVRCKSNDMTMNYMDYTDDPCMYMFTQGQKARMHALFASGGARASLAQ